jgi:hypothetical protein
LQRLTLLHLAPFRFFLPVCVDISPQLLGEAAAYIATWNKGKDFKFKWCSAGKDGHLFTERTASTCALCHPLRSLRRTHSSCVFAEDALRSYRSLQVWKKAQQKHFDALVKTASAREGDEAANLKEVFKPQIGGLRLDPSAIRDDAEFTKKIEEDSKEWIKTSKRNGSERSTASGRDSRNGNVAPTSSRRNRDMDEPRIKLESRSQGSSSRDDRGRDRYRQRSRSRSRSEYERDDSRARSGERRDRDRDRYDDYDDYGDKDRYRERRREDKYGYRDRSSHYEKEDRRDSRDVDYRRDPSYFDRRDRKSDRNGSTTHRDYGSRSNSNSRSRSRSRSPRESSRSTKKRKRSYRRSESRSRSSSRSRSRDRSYYYRAEDPSPSSSRAARTKGAKYGAERSSRRDSERTRIKQERT